MADTGSAHGGSCFDTLAEAAALRCSTLDGVYTSGTISCASVGTLTPGTRGGGSAVLNMRRYTNTGAATNYTQASQFVACEPYGTAYWADIWPTFITTLVVILCARWLFNFFRAQEVH